MRRLAVNKVKSHVSEGDKENSSGNININTSSLKNGSFSKDVCSSFEQDHLNCGLIDFSGLTDNDNNDSVIHKGEDNESDSDIQIHLHNFDVNTHNSTTTTLGILPNTTIDDKSGVIDLCDEEYEYSDAIIISDDDDDGSDGSFCHSNNLDFDLQCSFYESKGKRKSFGKATRIPTPSLEFTPNVSLDVSTYSISNITILERLMEECGQEELISIEDYFKEITCIEKVGEGSFAEVFKGRCSTYGTKDICFKIIPFDGDEDEAKSADEMLQEIIMTKAVSNLRKKCPNFSEVFGCHFCHGPYPEFLLETWDNWAENGKSENIYPDFYNEESRFIVMGSFFKGIDLEKFKFERINQAISIVLQLICCLAIAERSLKFEHRDLHWGNVIVCKTKEKTVTYETNGEQYEILTHGVEATIIDFTLSRLEINNELLFYDIEEEEIFDGSGDTQFDVYRDMREACGNNWKSFCPKTNILWMDYLIGKLLDEKKYSKKYAQKQKENREKLAELQMQILHFDSLSEVVSELELFEKLKKK